MTLKTHIFRQIIIMDPINIPWTWISRDFSYILSIDIFLLISILVFIIGRPVNLLVNLVLPTGAILSILLNLIIIHGLYQCNYILLKYLPIILIPKILNYGRHIKILWTITCSSNYNDQCFKSCTVLAVTTFLMSSLLITTISCFHAWVHYIIYVIIKDIPPFVPI